MQPMRIHFVLPTVDLSGGLRVVAIYAERLARRGHTVTLTSVPRRQSWRQRMGQLLRGGGYSRLRPPQPSHFDGRGVDHRVLAEVRPVRDEDLADADVVVATWWKTAEWVAALSPAKGAKVYFIQHDERHVSGTDDQVLPTWRLPMRRILVAQWLVPLLREHGVEGELTVVPNAVELAQFHAPPRGKQPRPTVGMMYSNVAFKGADLALEAFELARQEVPELRLVAFGKDDPDASMPLPPGAVYERNPPQDRLRMLYASCDAWLFASRCEGFGLPILEAMACRTPVIGTPVGAAPELLAAGGGRLVAPEDPAAMARMIVDVARMDDAAWREMSRQAHHTASGYTWDDATDAFEAALRRAALRHDQEPPTPAEPADAADDDPKELVCTR